MKPETSERLLVESLFKKSVQKNNMPDKEILDIEKLTGDASTRKYFRVKSDVLCYVACLDNPIFDEYSSFLSIQEVLDKKGVRVPRIFDKSLENGYLLEEDLGDMTLLHRLAFIDSPKEELEIYTKVVDELIRIHSIELDDIKKFPFSTLEFDKEKLQSEIDFTIKHLLIGLIGLDENANDIKTISKNFQKITSELGKAQKVLTHRDFHSRNVMVLGEENIIIDFQDARMGIPQYDLASLLDDCYYKISRANSYKLKTYYWDNFLKEKGLQKSFEEFEYLYDLMTLQRVFKAAGSFAFIYRTRGDERYLKYLSYAFEKIKEILMKYEELKDLRISLMTILYAY